MEEPSPAPRASDHDRDEVVERLRDAAADGRLTMVEFEERMDRAYASRTRQELAPLLADLPDDHAPARTVAAPVQTEISGFLSSHRRSRRWQVPRRLRTRLVMSSASLDLTEAVLPPEVEIDLALFMTSVELIVPQGVWVDTQPVTEILSSTSNRTDRPQTHSGCTIRVGGRSVMSSVTVRHPNALTQWWRGVAGGW